MRKTIEILPLKSGVGQYIVVQATLTARDFLLSSSPRAHLHEAPQLGAADAEIKVLSGENAELKCFPF